MLSFMEANNTASEELYEVEIILKDIGKYLSQSEAKEIFNALISDVSYKLLLNFFIL